MSNDRIRISFIEEYPSSNGNCSRIPHFRVGFNCLMPGIAVEIIGLLTNYLNLTIDVTKVKGYNQDYSYIYDGLYNNETDLLTTTFVKTSTRAIKFDFTKELYLTYTKIAVRKADHSLKSMFDFFNIYRWDVWISMIVVFLLFTAFGLLVRYVECQLRLRKRCSFAEILWKMVRFQLLQSEGIDYKLIAGGSSLLVFSLFQLCIILGLFQGYILTSVVKKVNFAPFTVNDDFPQMIKDRKVSIVATSLFNWLYHEIENSYQSPFYEFREALKSNPYKMVETNEDLLRTVEEGNGAVAFMAEDGFITFKSKNYCNLVLVDNQIPPGYKRFMFKKGSRFVQMFNEAIDANRYRIEMIKRKYFEYDPPSKCAMNKHGPTPLSMTPYYGLLIVFFIGMSSACFVFSGELLRWIMP